MGIDPDIYGAVVTLKFKLPSNADHIDSPHHQLHESNLESYSST